MKSSITLIFGQMISDVFIQSKKISNDQELIQSDTKSEISLISKVNTSTF